MDNIVQITLPIYWQETKKKKVLIGMNWYRNAHFHALNKLKRHFNYIVSTFKIEEKLESPIHIHYSIFFKRRGSDGGNVRSIIEKFALDALKHNGVIVDDNFEIVVSDSAEYHLDKSNPRAELTVIGKSI